MDLCAAWFIDQPWKNIDSRFHHVIQGHTTVLSPGLKRKIGQNIHCVMAHFNKTHKTSKHRHTYIACLYFYIKWINLPLTDLKKKRKINMWNYWERLSCEKAKQRCLQLTWERTAELDKSILVSISDHKYLVT